MTADRAEQSPNQHGDRKYGRGCAARGAELGGHRLEERAEAVCDAIYGEHPDERRRDHPPSARRIELAEVWNRLDCFGSRRRHFARPFSSAARAAFISFSFDGATFGYSGFNFSILSISASATITRVNHLLSAGTTYQGASGVEVFSIMS